MTILKIYEEYWMSSIYKFWKEMMTDEEKIDFSSHASSELKNAMSDTYDGVPMYLSEVFGSDYAGIFYILDKRSGDYFIHYVEDNNGHFLIWEFDQ